MPDIFLSYVGEDADVVEPLAQALEAAGYTTWYYTRDSLPDPSYLVQTYEAIAQAQAVLLVISTHALHEPHQVTLEVERAHEQGRPFLPLLRDVPHEALAQVPQWRQALGTAVSTPIPPTGVTTLVPRLLQGLRALGVTPAVTAAPRPQPPSAPGGFTLAAAPQPNVLATTLRHLRQRLARSWRRLGAGLALLVLGAHGVQALDLAEMPVPGGVGRVWSLGLDLALFMLTRFPRLARLVTRLILGPVPPPSSLPRVFRGPRPYQAEDVLPGRQRECDDCWTLLRAAPFCILEGESGCGKSSLLNAALLPRAQQAFQAITCRLAHDPFGQLCAALRQQPYRAAPIPPSAATLAGVLAQAALAAPKPVLLCIDQGEELFVTVRDTVRVECLAVLRDAIAAGHVRLLITLRSDFRDLLDRLCRDLDPSQQVFHLGQYYTLQALRAPQARAVLDELLRPAAAQDTRLRQQLDDFAGALVADLLRPPRDQRLCQEDEKTVLPVELQTIGMLLESVGVHQMSVAGLRRQGGKAGLMRTYLDDAKTYAWHTTGVPADQTLLVLRQLISPAGTKWTQTAAAIGWDVGLPAAQVARVLDAFAAKYLVNPLPAESAESAEDDPVGAQRYELMHEYLIQILAEAPDPTLQRAQDAAERLRFWAQRTRAALAPEAPRAPWWRLARLRAWFAKPIPLLESLRLWRYARRGEERRMLRRNVRGWGARVLLRLLVVSSLWGYLYVDLTRWVANMGELVVHNAPGATLTLRCLRHYGEKVACAFDAQALAGRSVFLTGPADYLLTARLGTAWDVRYPVYIEGYGKGLAVTVEPPPARLPEGMAFIPGGVFQMGFKVEGSADEKPAHAVDVDGFVLDQYEVTNAQYQQCVAAGQCTAPSYEDGQCYSDITPGGFRQGKVDRAYHEDAKPVVCVDWQQAQAYCAFRGKRLPTEAEWEKAAAGPERSTWAFGDQFDGTKVNFCDKNCPFATASQADDGYATTAPVGTYPANGYGLYDMSGNVWEWVADWYDAQFYATPASRQKNPENRAEGAVLRVVRGGAWHGGAVFLRAAIRGWSAPAAGGVTLGVRCAAAPSR